MWLTMLLTASTLILPPRITDGAPAKSRAAAAPVTGLGTPWLENRGQWRPDIAFGTWVGPVWVGVGADGLDLFFEDPSGYGPQRVRVGLAEGPLTCRGLDQVPGLFHDYHGDPSRWTISVRAYGEVELTDGSGGLHLTVFERGGRVVLAVDETASGPLRMTFSEFARTWSTTEGGLQVETSAGSIVLETRSSEHNAPQASGGSKAPSEAQAFPARPELTWSTLWGTVPTIFCNLHDFAEDACVDSQGRVTVVGTVAGYDYLLTPGAYTTGERCDDIFVAKFDQATGDLVYSARIGSTQMDEGNGIAVDSIGRATVVGWVGQGGQEFPTTPNAFDPVKSQLDYAGVVFRLSTEGSQLEYSTFLEGDNGADAFSVAVASSGAAVVVGTTDGTFPTTPGAYSTQGQIGDIFVTRLDPTGSFLEFSTLIGGAASDVPARVRLDAQESVILAGKSGLDYPTTPGAFKSQGQMGDAFVSCLDSTGSTLLWSTLLGGSNSEVCHDMALAPDGGAILVGMSKSTDFPTTPGALQENDPGDWNAWATRVDPGGTTLRYSTFIGGTKKDLAYSVITDRSGMAMVGGEQGGQTGFPLTPGAFQSTPSGGIFSMLLPPDGSKALYTGILGGAGSGRATAMTIGPAGLVTLGGQWTPSNGTGGPFPTTPGALVPAPLGSADAFITTLQPLLQGVQLAGTSSPSCLGPVNANATTMPLAGQPFGLYCTQAPPDADGYLITFTGEFILSIQPVKAGPEGFLETDLVNLPNTPGKLRRYRYAFRNTPTCPGQGAFSFSNMVVVQVQ